jgi:hypothetical protein
MQIFIKWTTIITFILFIGFIYAYNNIPVDIINNGVTLHTTAHYAIDWYLFGCDLPEVVYP